MKRVLITGMSGVGKSTVLDELAARGYKTVDTDYGHWQACVSVNGAPEWAWHEERIRQLLATEDAEVLFVSGTVSNQGKFYPQFDHVVLLSAPTPVLLGRLATPPARTKRQWGSRRRPPPPTRPSTPSRWPIGPASQLDTGSDGG